MTVGNYLAHISEDGREQTVHSHLQGTARRCRGFASDFAMGDLGELTGLLHDIGKYSDAFQRRLQGGPKVDHSTAGAYECFRQNQPLAAMAVAGHHGGLPDLGTRDDRADQSTFLGRMNRAKEGKLEDYDVWRNEVTAPLLPPQLSRDPLSDMFFTRMLYSCLVDADFLDTEQFVLGETDRGGGSDMDALERSLQEHIENWFPPKGELNQQRCAILRECLAQANTQKPGLFTLTVPTGGGKTVASLAFALRHAKAYGMQRIVYVIPYTSIIEQTAEEFRKILGLENVLEHHSGVTYDTSRDEETNRENLRLLRATENWDMPVVVTTAVQFFESLYANRPSKCRKLHNLARSVIIFDEAQMLPLPYLRPCVSAIAQLVEHYDVSAVLCTATQPVLEKLLQEFLPERQTVELCPQRLAAHPVFRRTTFRRAGRLTWGELADMLNAQTQILCIVNSRKNAQEVYSRLEKSGSFHLSTLMVPAHRKKTLEEIRRRLRAGLPCRVVSTSLIEAGVDVDFPSVFREEAGLDSILQAAGRCNREGRRSASDSMVTIFQAETAPPPLFGRAIGAAQSAMDSFDDYSFPESIHHYFTELLELSGRAAQDQKGILRKIESGGFPFRTVAEEFHLIENNTQTVYVPLDEGKELVERLRKGEVSRTLFRALGQYGVSVYDRHYQALLAAGAIEPLPDGESAILADLRLYSEGTGLSLDADGGHTLWG